MYSELHDLALVRSQGCQWIEDIDSLGPADYCGSRELASNSVYCCKHHALAYQQGTAAGSQRQKLHDDQHADRAVQQALREIAALGW
jgi:hypothetical protein